MDHASIHPGIWGILCQDATGTLDIPADLAEDVPPMYEGVDPTLSLSTGLETGTLVSSSTRGDNRSLDSGLPPELSSSPSPSRPPNLQRTRSFLQMDVHEPLTYTYHLVVGNTHLQVIILVESDQESDRPNHYTFSLSMKIGPVERAISEPVTMKLSIHPRKLNFVVFAFPPRSSLPTGCLHHLRVWLRTPAGIDHRIFSEQDLWFGRDPDFTTIANASFASLRNTTQDMSIYQGIVGRAHVNFTIRWKPVETGIYAFALDYEAGGVGKTLFENYHLRLYCEPHTITFLIYSIPVSSNPPGASHRLRFWICTPHPHVSHHATEAYLYQRLWKSDEFKIGAHLSFESIGHKIILATREQDEQTPMFDGGPLMPLAPNRRRISRLAPSVGIDEAGEFINDR